MKRPGPARPSPAVTLFDALFHSQFRRCKLTILTQSGYRFRIVVGKFEAKLLDCFEIIAFSREVGFLVIFFFKNKMNKTLEPLNICSI